ncbi:MAG: carbamoyl-phosphate synthase large subunit [Actinobacteria bacterium]|nr:carbamoyl-phosphate synthase large subunit [Actinomycetota bacterium]
MPRRADIRTILVLGSGPIVIGQAGEFDYSGTQACRALREEGYRVVLVNSNPATIMTDPDVADRTYVEPLDVETLSAIIAREAPDALLPTLGGQTALNLAIDLDAAGVLATFGVEMIGADSAAIKRAEDRDTFRECMRGAGIPMLESRVVTSLAEAVGALEALGLPLILRPAFTLGGQGGGVANTAVELAALTSAALAASPIGQVLVEQSVIGWGEFELEVVRDLNDNAIVVCAIENVDPMGVHTGDSVTVAPPMTLTDGELQRMRDAALAVIRAVGVATGGANVQFALNRATGQLVVIEMNPRVSRSSALASKATGFPIATVAARLAVGYTLDELPNEITRVTPASFEPALDYVAIKAPRFAFEKIPGAVGELSTFMQSVGEVLALGSTFREAFGKAMSARELDVVPDAPPTRAAAEERLRVPRPDRYDVMLAAVDLGVSARELADWTGVHPWFCAEIVAFASAAAALRSRLGDIDARALRTARREGLTDRHIAAATGATEADVAAARRRLGVRASFHAVDTCAGEFAARTPYFYRALESASEAERGDRPAVVVLGSGPNRIGQGVEFDYCCVHAAQAVRALGHDAVMVNCNPETVSTDHGVSDRLYLEPVTLEAVLDVCAHERPVGVIVQLGGQTPLRLAQALLDAGVPILGTQPAAIDLAEDRGRFGALLADLGLEAPPWAVAETPDGIHEAVRRVGFPLLLRPSYVLGGRAMAVCGNANDVAEYVLRERPGGVLLVDRFLDGAIEVDVDALCDGHTAWVAGVMEHVEAAGVHSGDSACVLPPQRLGAEIVTEIERQAALIAVAIGAVGLVNVQFAVQDGHVFVIEANPRAARTVPFVAKATGVPLVRHAVALMLGASLDQLHLPATREMGHVAVKEAVLPFNRFPGADPVLGPEMRATGEVMAIAPTFSEAFAKAQRAALQGIPHEGLVFLSARDSDKRLAADVARAFAGAGFTLTATRGTAATLARHGIHVPVVDKVSEGSPNVADMIQSGGVALVINTPGGADAMSDGRAIRRAAIRAGIPCVTTIDAALAIGAAVRDGIGRGRPVALQDLLNGPRAVADRST